MFRRLSRHIIQVLLAISLLMLPAAGLAAPKWEMPKTERTELPVVAHDTDVTVKAAKGVIVVTSNKPVNVKIFTILGQQISNDTLPAGTSQLTLSSHGVFIVKIGELTCKVAL